MSGPITCGYFIFHGILLMAGRALEEARAMRQEYGDVLARLQERERTLAQTRDAMRAARVERIAAVRRQAARQAARHARLVSLAQSAGVGAPVAPGAPTGDDDEAWTAYAAALDSAVRELEVALGDTHAMHAEKVRAALAMSGETASIDDVLEGYARQRSLRPGLDPSQAERLRATAARVLARLDLGEGRALPIELETLAREIVLAPTLERAEALATELRRAVQDANAAQQAQRVESDEARRLLAAMPEDAPAPLLRALEHVAAGVARLDAALRDAAQSVLDEATEARERAEQSAAALVLTESLRDLGYEVDDIEATLFVDGGTTHFRRDGWDRYFVRMRIDPKARSINFNVVRPKGAAESAEQRRQDTLAEDRWCAEFPKLMQTLEARGLKLTVERRLEAGAVPVQVVDPASLPHVAQDEDAAPRAAPRARPIG
ncbi:MAG: hypothetical protein U1F54_05035 [Burkholderiales bacterium]